MQRTRLDTANVRAALDRLVLLGYLVAIDRDGETAYEPPGAARE